MKRTDSIKRILIAALTVILSCVFAVFCFGCDDTPDVPDSTPSGPQENVNKRLSAKEATAAAREKANSAESYTVRGTVSYGLMNGANVKKALLLEKSGDESYLLLDGVIEVFVNADGTFVKDLSSGETEFTNKSEFGLDPADLADMFFDYALSGALRKKDRADKGYDITSEHDYRADFLKVQIAARVLKDYSLKDLAESEALGEYFTQIAEFIKDNPDITVSELIETYELRSYVEIALKNFDTTYDEFIAAYGAMTVVEFLDDPEISEFIDPDMTLTELLKNLRVTDLDILATETKVSKAKVIVTAILDEDCAMSAFTVGVNIGVEDFPRYYPEENRFKRFSGGFTVSLTASVEDVGTTAIANPLAA